MVSEPNPLRTALERAGATRKPRTARGTGEREGPGEGRKEGNGGKRSKGAAAKEGRKERGKGAKAERRKQPETRVSKYDWPKLQRLYVQEGWPPKRLSEQFGVPLASVYNRAHRDNWPELRNKYVLRLNEENEKDSLSAARKRRKALADKLEAVQSAMLDRLLKRFEDPEATIAVADFERIAKLIASLQEPGWDKASPHGNGNDKSAPTTNVLVAIGERISGRERAIARIEAADDEGADAPIDAVDVDCEPVDDTRPDSDLSGFLIGQPDAGEEEE